MSTPDNSERRQFSRILFNAACTLHSDDFEWSTEVLDISLKGLLVKKPDYCTLRTGSNCEAVVNLAGVEASIVMSLSLTHIDDNSLGFRCDYIDLDSMSHLKRLVQLNVGDDSILRRELESLSS